MALSFDDYKIIEETLNTMASNIDDLEKQRNQHVGAWDVYLKTDSPTHVEPLAKRTTAILRQLQLEFQQFADAADGLAVTITESLAELAEGDDLEYPDDFLPKICHNRCLALKAHCQALADQIDQQVSDMTKDSNKS